MYDETDFERRFRVPRAVDMRIVDACKDQPSFRQRINATGRAQAHPLRTVAAAFRVMVYGEAYERADEYVRLSRSTISVVTKKLVSFIVSRFTTEHLRQPTVVELRSILKRNVERGLPRCIASLNCSQRRWTARPKGFQGRYQSGADKGIRSIVLEAAGEEDLWIWTAMSAQLGALTTSMFCTSRRCTWLLRVATGRQACPTPSTDGPGTRPNISRMGFIRGTPS